MSTKQKPLSYYLFPTLSLALSVALVITYISLSLSMPIGQLFHHLVKNIYRPSHNLIFAVRLNGIGAKFYFYIMLLLSCGFNALFKFCFRKNAPPAAPGPRESFFMQVIGIFLLFNLLYIYSFGGYVVKELRFFQDKTIEERFLSLPGKYAYKFSQFAKTILRRPYSAEFISDLDPEVEPGMSMHRVLSYHLYPIDIRGVRGTSPSPDVLIIFVKKNARAGVPDDYQVVGVFEEDGLIAARKEKVF